MAGPAAGQQESTAAPRSADGLTAVEVLSLRERFGYNELPEKKVNPVLQFLGHLWGPIPWMIEVAAALAVVVQHWADLAIILVLLLVNGVVGFWEEWQAGNAISALKAGLAVRARVFRDGTWSVIPARELVPGDRVRVRLGDVAPADIRLLEGAELEVNQSSLTGESLPVPKKAGEVLYSGSTVTRGEAAGGVVATGASTFFGRAAELVESAHTVSHFQRAVLRIGNYLIVTAVLLAIVIEAISLLRGKDPLTSLQFALVLTVAAIPVAMPTVLSVTMAVGARRMARRQAVVTRLSAMEELAGMDVLCSDKTGTLTQNRLTLGETFVVAGESAESVIVAAGLASLAEDRDPIDAAILAQAPAAKLAEYAVEKFDPFDPASKRTEARVRGPGGETRSFSKGACQVIFDLTALAGPERASADAAVAGFASRGYRTLGVAATDASGRWRFLGILSLHDPLRDDAREVVNEARALGVDVKLLTGDHVAIGRETARLLGLGTRFLTAAEVEEAQGSKGEGAKKICEADGYAQVFPADKFAIVERFQEQGHIVGMTGDGVNDAPALKKADVGIAVSGSTDAARGAASIVLLAPGLRVLVDAIAESRRIFARMTAYAMYRVGETIRVLLFLTLSIVAFDLYPVTTVMIVLLAVLNDGAILSIAYDRAPRAERPTRWEMRNVLSISTVFGGVGVLTSFLLFYLALHVWALPFPMVQTLVYLKLSVAGHFMIFAARTKGPFWSTRPAPVLVAAVIGTQTLATGIAVSGWLLAPLPLLWVGVVWGFAMAGFVANDLAKQVAYRWLERGRGAGPTRAARTSPPPVRALFYRPRFASPSKPSPPFPAAPKRAPAGASGHTAGGGGG